MTSRDRRELAEGDVPPVFPRGYRPLAFLGEGGWGQVWQALREDDGASVAVKLLRGDLGEEQELRRRFRREARLAMGLRHPALVSLLDCGEEADTPWLAFEHVPGGDLEARIRREGALPPPEAAAVLRTLCGGLQALHDAGILHRDLKPANVLLDGTERPRICDLGLATSAWVSRMTRTGSLLGTPAYLAPEILRGERPGTAADVYGLGTILFECLQGHPPFPETDDLASLLRRVEREPPLRSRRLGAAPALRRLDELVDALLAKTPADRPSLQDLTTCLDALRPALDALPKRKDGAAPTLFLDAPPGGRVPVDGDRTPIATERPSRGPFRKALGPILLLLAVATLLLGRSVPPLTIDALLPSPVALELHGHGASGETVRWILRREGRPLREGRRRLGADGRLFLRLGGLEPGRSHELILERSADAPVRRTFLTPLPAVGPESVELVAGPGFCRTGLRGSPPLPWKLELRATRGGRPLFAVTRSFESTAPPELVHRHPALLSCRASIRCTWSLGESLRLEGERSIDFRPLFDPPGEGDEGAAIAGAPLPDAEGLVVADTLGRLRAFDEGGRGLWSLRLPFAPPPTREWSPGSSPPEHLHLVALTRWKRFLVVLVAGDPMALWILDPTARRRRGSSVLDEAPAAGAPNRLLEGERMVRLDRKGISIRRPLVLGDALVVTLRMRDRPLEDQLVRVALPTGRITAARPLRGGTHGAPVAVGSRLVYGSSRAGCVLEILDGETLTPAAALPLPACSKVQGIVPAPSQRSLFLLTDGERHLGRIALASRLEEAPFPDARQGEWSVPAPLALAPPMLVGNRLLVPERRKRQGATIRLFTGNSEGRAVLGEWDGVTGAFLRALDFVYPFGQDFTRVRGRSIGIAPDGKVLFEFSGHVCAIHPDRPDESWVLPIAFWSRHPMELWKRTVTATPKGRMASVFDVVP